MSRKDKLYTKQYIIDQMSDNEVDLSMNELTTVPVRELAQVPRGNRLDLSRNQLKILPENFGNLNHLIDLDLSCNKLQSLPDSFGELALLQKLDLYSNQLTRLPLTFWNLRKLKWLDLKNNPLEPGLRDAAGTCVTSRDCNHCATQVMAYIKLQLSADRNRKNAVLEKMAKREQLQKAEEDLIRAATKREKEARRRQKREEHLQQKQELLDKEEDAIMAARLETSEPACGRARIIERKINLSVMSVCSAVLMVSVTIMLILVIAIMLCNNFFEPSYCQSVRLGFIKTMAYILEVLGAKVD